MKINKILDGIINEQSILKTTKTKPIVDAITYRNPISFIYIGPRKPKNDGESEFKSFLNHFERSLEGHGKVFGSCSIATSSFSS